MKDSIFIVEQDTATLELLQQHLDRDGFEVFGSEDLVTAERRIREESPNLVLVSLAMPGALGLLGTIRSEHPRTGVIVVSRRSTERERVKALTQGAYDYIQAPFAYGELLARIRAVLKKRVQVVKVGPLEIDHSGRTVKLHGRSVRLSNKEFELLKELAAEPTRVLLKPDLLRTIWGYPANGHTRTLEAHVSRLRCKLDPDRSLGLVSNCWGVGYRLLDPEMRDDESDRGQYTVVGVFVDADDQRFADTYAAEDPDDAVRQAHENTTGDLLVAGVLRGAVEVAA